MELAILRAEVSRLADKCFWLKHAFAVLESEQPWDEHDQRFARAVRHALGENRRGGRRILATEPWCMGTDTRGWSVWLADGGTDQEAADAIRQIRALSDHVAEALVFRSRWEKKAQLRIVGMTSGVRDGVVMSESNCQSNSLELLLDHLHVVYQPHREYSALRVDDELIKVGACELHCGVFRAVHGCLVGIESTTPPERSADNSGEAIPPADRTRPMTLGEAAQHSGRNGAALRPKVQKALDYIKSKPNSKALTIANALGIEEITFLRHYVPKLKEVGVRNEGDGYFLPE